MPGDFYSWNHFNIFSYSTCYHAAGKLRWLIYVYYKHSLNVIIRAAFCHNFYHSINLHFTMYLLLSKCIGLIRGLKWIHYRKFTTKYFTSPNPSSILTRINIPTLWRAARGVKIVNTEVQSTPRPNKYFPPNRAPSHPPGNWVMIYP